MCAWPVAGVGSEQRSHSLTGPATLCVCVCVHPPASRAARLTSPPGGVLLLSACLGLTNQPRRLCLNRVSADIVDIKPANMEELTEVITAAEFHPHQCNVFVYSSSKGTIRLCDMRSSALCDRHSKCKCLACGDRLPDSFCFQMLRCP